MINDYAGAVRGMNFEEQIAAQMQAAKVQADCAHNVSENATTRRKTLREESEESVVYHQREAERRNRAAAFFRENPAFDEFLQLIRAGTIQI
jgi:hypothetical protein